MTERLKIGTRRSPLARRQTELVRARLARLVPDYRLEVVPIETSGDRDRTIGGSPDFTDAIDRALLLGDVDLGVHSAKDLPVVLDAGLSLLACPRRADPRDGLVVADRLRGVPLPPGARVGSSSLRRRAQLLRSRPDLTVVAIRGNVETRVGRVRSGELDAVILAVAGLERLGRLEELDRILHPPGFLPAPAQGALAVVGRVREGDLARAASRIDHAPTRACVLAERAFAAALGGDCQVPLGALARTRGRRIGLVGEVLSPDGRKTLRRRAEGATARAEALGRRMGVELLERGGLELLSSPPK